ncbi:helix-turn-helix domain-containing protein [Rheinheimera sp.]|uniref:helix-turn-helix domain-containing protein n=1 Tax=Rheinheimera sp. TaxID=1869214 RepID=UPI003AF4E7C6
MAKDQSWVKRGAGAVERIEASFSGLAYAPHSHDSYTFALTTGGVQSFHYRGELRHSLPGEVVILHPDEVHDGQAGTESPFSYRAISVDPMDVQAVLQGCSLPFLPGGVSRDTELIQIANRLLAELNRPLQRMDHQELVFSFASCLQRLSHTRVQHTRANYQAMKRVREFLDDMLRLDCNLSFELTLDELAAVAQYSKWQVTRDFRALYGTTPYRYITLKRLQKAKSMIEQGLPLVQAAFDSGFADQSHLSRHFKNCFGTTPKLWARLVQAAGFASPAAHATQSPGAS